MSLRRKTSQHTRDGSASSPDKIIADRTQPCHVRCGQHLLASLTTSGQHLASLLHPSHDDNVERVEGQAMTNASETWCARSTNNYVLKEHDVPLRLELNLEPRARKYACAMCVRYGVQFTGCASRSSASSEEPRAVGRSDQARFHEAAQVHPTSLFFTPAYFKKNMRKIASVSRPSTSSPRDQHPLLHIPMHAMSQRPPPPRPPSKRHHPKTDQG